MSRRRRIKRDLATIPKKGVAGLRLGGEEPPSPPPKSPGGTGGDTTPVAPSNTPQTPAGGRTSGDTTPDRRDSIHQVVEQIRSLGLRTASDEERSDASDEDVM